MCTQYAAKVSAAIKRIKHGSNKGSTRFGGIEWWLANDERKRLLATSDAEEG
jgi:hypothetical protein